MRRVWVLLAALSAVTALGQTNQDAAKPAENKVETVKPAAAKTPDDYKIGAEDILAINVWREPEMSRVVQVRADGRISLPLIGEFEAANATSRELEAKITKQLGSLVTNPQVTVMVQEMRSQKYSITGEVSRPGTYILSPSMTLLDAIATAGGMRDFAKPKKMYVLRRNAEGGNPTKLNVNYRDMLEGKIPALALQARDTVVVP